MRSEAVQAILDEIARRQKLWEQLQLIAKDVLKSVNDYAKSSGIGDMAWFYTPYPNGALPGMSFAWGSEKHRGYRFWLKISASGEIENGKADKDGAHKGYPPLQDDDVEKFPKLAAETFLAQLHKHIETSKNR